MKLNSVLTSDEKVDMTPMIDVIFLLLIYFMYLPIQQEADLGIQLPANTAPAKRLNIPNEQIIAILPNDVVTLNGMPMDHPDSRVMPKLTTTLIRLKLSADRTELKTIVLIIADDFSNHQRAIDVMNACASAGIKTVTFSEG